MSSIAVVQYVPVLCHVPVLCMLHLCPMCLFPTMIWTRYCRTTESQKNSGYVTTQYSRCVLLEMVLYYIGFELSVKDSSYTYQQHILLAASGTVHLCKWSNAESKFWIARNDRKLTQDFANIVEKLDTSFQQTLKNIVTSRCAILILFSFNVSVCNLFQFFNLWRC